MGRAEVVVNMEWRKGERANACDICDACVHVSVEGAAEQEYTTKQKFKRWRLQPQLPARVK